MCYEAEPCEIVNVHDFLYAIEQTKNMFTFSFYHM